jgi:hypothetical protein
MSKFRGIVLVLVVVLLRRKGSKTNQGFFITRIKVRSSARQTPATIEAR